MEEARMVDDQDWCEWVNVSSSISSPGCPAQRIIKQLLLLDCCDAPVFLHLVYHSFTINFYDINDCIESFLNHSFCTI